MNNTIQSILIRLEMAIQSNLNMLAKLNADLSYCTTLGVEAKGLQDSMHALTAHNTTTVLVKSVYNLIKSNAGNDESLVYTLLAQQLEKIANIANKCGSNAAIVQACEEVAEILYRFFQELDATDIDNDAVYNAYDKASKAYCEL
jgi:hypothetical protein